MKEAFRKLASRISNAAGNASAFLGAMLIVIVWAATGPLFKFSNTWQLVINTGTTIITFLMVFLIQNTQNRDSKAMQLKLDELLRSGRGRNSFIDIEDLSDDELGWLDNEFKKLHENGTPAPVMHKLHQKIQAAHKERQSLRSNLGQIADALNPFNHPEDQAKK
jgi:low affinity Fe/Cu permease